MTPESVRARRSRSSTSARIRSTSVSMSSRASPTSETGDDALRRRSSTDPRTTASGRPQLVRRISGEFALATHRLADGHERAVRVDPAEGQRGREDRQPTDQQDRDERGEGPQLGRAVTDDLDDEDPFRSRQRRRVDPDRRAGEFGERHGVDPGPRLRQARALRERDRADREDRSLLSCGRGGAPDDRERARCRSTDDDPRRRGDVHDAAASTQGADRQPAREGQPGLHVGRPRPELFLARGREGGGGHAIQQRSERDEDDERRPATPRQQAPPDSADERVVVGHDSIIR